MGSDMSPFNVSLIVQGEVTRQCPQITWFFLKNNGEPKRGVELASFHLPAERLTLPPGQAGSLLLIPASQADVTSAVRSQHDMGEAGAVALRVPLH